MNPNAQGYRPSGLMTPAELDAAAKQREEAANSEMTDLQLSKDRLEREELDRLIAEKREAANYRDIGENKVNGGIQPLDPDPAVVKPKVYKFAAPVPGKPGFVYNPFTHNQVKVEGIPSGTKVRDPHDTNPAHIFRVP
jgi:hypothetical protein